MLALCLSAHVKSPDFQIEWNPENGQTASHTRVSLLKFKLAPAIQNSLQNIDSFKDSVWTTSTAIGGTKI